MSVMSKQKRLDTRYAWIEASLRYTGKFEKVSYSDWFDINAPQISADQAGFVRAMNHEFAHRQRQAGDGDCAPVLAIVKGKISVLRDLPSRPVFDVPDIREWLQTSAAIPFVRVDDFNEVTPPEDIMRQICAAILRKRPLRIALACDTGKSWRDVSPHAIIDASGRLHMRAFDHHEEKFSDYALSRVMETGPHSRNVQYVGSEADADWTETSEMVLEIDHLQCVDQPGPPSAALKSWTMSRRISIPRALSRFLSQGANTSPTHNSVRGAQKETQGAR